MGNQPQIQSEKEVNDKEKVESEVKVYYGEKE